MIASGKKIAVAMSGGVDSSVTACLLLEQGYEVGGVFMALAQPDLDEQVERVQKVAGRLDVPLTVIDLAAPFRESVLAYFTNAYLAGKTPNPCMICNPTIKFGRLLQAVLEKGFDMMATGHYARLQRDDNGITRLLKGRDSKKDQSYFLSQLQQQQLCHLLFPLGEFEKSRVYELAANFGIAGVHGKESQDVCFLKERTVSQFLDEAQPKVNPGDIVTRSGDKLGVHQGIHRYTVGQRRGLGICDATPYYVVGLDVASNAVVVGKEDELWRRDVLVKDVTWQAGEKMALPFTCSAKIRYSQQTAPAILQQGENGQVLLSFEEPQRAISPGQYAVFYNDDEVLGGGEIVG